MPDCQRGSEDLRVNKTGPLSSVTLRPVTTARSGWSPCSAQASVPCRSFLCALPVFPLCPAGLSSVPCRSFLCALPVFPLCPARLSSVPCRSFLCALPIFPLCPAGPLSCRPFLLSCPPPKCPLGHPLPPWARAGHLAACWLFTSLITAWISVTVGAEGRTRSDLSSAESSSWHSAWCPGRAREMFAGRLSQ